MQHEIFEYAAEFSYLAAAHNGRDKENRKLEIWPQEKPLMVQQNTSRLRIAYLTQLDPFDKRSFSSGMYYMGQALQRHCGEVTYLGPLGSYNPLSRPF